MNCHRRGAAVGAGIATELLAFSLSAGATGRRWKQRHTSPAWRPQSQ